MPTSVGPNTFGEENLVFGYDLGDVSNSYKGEPTTNTAVIDNYYTYWDNSGTATWSNNDTTIPRLFPDLPVMSMYKLTDGNSHLGLGYSNQVTTSTEYTYSVYVWIPSSNSAGMAGSAPYFRPQPANYGAVTLSYNGSTSWGTWPRDQWIRVSGTATTQSTNVTNAYISCYLNTTGDKIFFTAPQMEQKGHITPFTRTSRSATQGLLDLTGNSTIDLSNVSFDSNAQMTFDGSSNKLAFPSGLNIPSLGGSIEMVVKRNGTSTNRFLFSKVESDTNRYYMRQPTETTFDAVRGNPLSSTSFGTINTGVYYHLVMIWQDTNLYAYKNGVLESSTTFTNPGSNLNTSGAYIGAFDGGASGNIDADIPVAKFYNRALTASEVASNYKAIKGRFNI